RYEERLLRWNRSVSNLISRNDEKRLVTRHLLESIEPADWIKQNGVTNCIDFGSGSGLPAVPLAIAGIGHRWTLVDSRRPKVLFVRSVLQDLALANIETIHGRLEGLDNPDPLFDSVTSRATLRLSPTLVMVSRFVSIGGQAYLWKGRRWEDEMEADERWKQFWEFDGVIGISDASSVVT